MAGRPGAFSRSSLGIILDTTTRRATVGNGITYLRLCWSATLDPIHDDPGVVAVGKQAKDKPRGLDANIYFRPRKDGQGGAYHYYFVDPEDKHQRSIKVADAPAGKERDPEVIQEANNNAGAQKTALANLGKVLKPAEITVSQAWEKFLSRTTTKNPHRKPLKHSSKQDYRSQWNNYLEPKFGKLKVIELTEWRVEAFQEWLDTLVFEGTAAELRAANAVLRRPITEANAEIRRENKRRPVSGLLMPSLGVESNPDNVSPLRAIRGGHHHTSRPTAWPVETSE